MIIYSNIENVNSKTVSGGKSFQSMDFSSFLGTSGSETDNKRKQGFSC